MKNLKFLSIVIDPQQDFSGNGLLDTSYPEGVEVAMKLIASDVHIEVDDPTRWAPHIVIGTTEDVHPTQPPPSSGTHQGIAKKA